MAQPFRDEDGAPSLRIQRHRGPAPVAGRPDAKVDHYVQDRPAHAGDVFCLAGRDITEMDSPDRAAQRHRAVGLRDLQAAADISQDGCVTKPFQEAPPLVAVNTRSEDPRPFDTERIHQKTVAARAAPRYDLTSSSHLITRCCR